MKKLLLILLAVAMTACAAPATPAAQPVATSKAKVSQRVWVRVGAGIPAQ